MARTKSPVQAVADTATAVGALTAAPGADITAEQARADVRLLTAAQASEALGGRPTEGTLKNYRSLGIGPRYVKMGRSVGYRVEDLKEWLAGQVVETDPAVEFVSR